MNAAAEVRYFPQTHFSQLETRFDPEFGVLWGLMSPKPRPTFNPSLLAELRGYVDSIMQPGGLSWHEGRQEVINYAVIAAKVPGVFSLGGDLSLFRLASANQDRNMLVQYGRKCIDNLCPWSRNCYLPLATI